MSMLEMLPRPALNYMADCATVNTIEFSEPAVSERRRPDGENLHLSEFGLRSMFSSGNSAAYDGIFHVSLLGIVSEIIDTVVEAIAIVVAYMQSIRSWSNKCGCHQNMDMPRDLFLTNFGKPYAMVSSAGNCWIQQFFTHSLWYAIAAYYYSFQRAHAPKVGNLVSAFVTRDGLPYFFHAQPPFVELIRKRGTRQPIRKSVFGLDTLAVQGTV